MSDDELSLQAFLRDLRWMVPIALVVGLGFGVWELLRGEPAINFLMGLAVGPFFLVCLGPLFWLRWSVEPRSWAEAKRTLAATALAAAWAAAWILALALWTTR